MSGDSVFSNKSVIYLVMESTTLPSKETIPASSTPPPAEPLYKFIEDNIAILRSTTMILE